MFYYSISAIESNIVLHPFYTFYIDITLLERSGNCNLANIFVGNTFVEHCQHRGLKVGKVVDDRRNGNCHLDRTHVMTVLVKLQHRKDDIARNGTVYILIICQSEIHRRDGSHGICYNSL